MASLCFRSKAYWGYDDAFMKQCRAVLMVNPDLVQAGHAAVAEDAGTLLGVAQIDVDGPAAELDLLFVDPAAMGKGIGAVLYHWACDTARSAGAKSMMILSDPGARPFYERMGAGYLRHEPSDAIPGRTLPLLKASL